MAIFYHQLSLSGQFEDALFDHLGFCPIFSPHNAHNFTLLDLILKCNSSMKIKVQKSKNTNDIPQETIEHEFQ